MPKGLSQQTSARLLFGSTQHPKLMGRTSRKDNPDLIYTYIWNVIYAFYAVCFHENMVIFCIWLLVPKGMRRNIQIVYKMKKKKKQNPQMDSVLADNVLERNYVGRTERVSFCLL